MYKKDVNLLWFEFCGPLKITYKKFCNEKGPKTAIFGPISQQTTKNFALSVHATYTKPIFFLNLHTQTYDNIRVSNVIDQNSGLDNFFTLFGI